MRATTISDLARPSLAKGVRLQIDSTTGKNVLLYPEGIVELNETAHEILSRCDGRTLGEIICELAEEYEADSNALAADVRDTLVGFAATQTDRIQMISVPRPYALLAEITYRCPLHCPYCSNPVSPARCAELRAAHCPQRRTSRPAALGQRTLHKQWRAHDGRMEAGHS